MFTVNRVFKAGICAAYLATLTGASVIVCSPALAAEPTSEEPAHARWREIMIGMDTPHEGCFQATFPSTLWETIPCRTLSEHAHPVPRRVNPGQPQTTGNGNDYALVAGGLINQTVGSFPSVSDVLSEFSAGVPLIQNAGILGPNEYSLQINTNDNSSTSACYGGASECTVWQQFLYSTDYEVQGSAAVYMQYWLLGFGPKGASCPSGYWSQDTLVGTDCYKNSGAVSAPDVPITGLGNLKLTGKTVPGGSDTVTLTLANGTQVYSVNATDSVLRIGTVWTESEFNIVGDAGGSEALFNPGAAITVNVAATFGSSAAPMCETSAGTTGETNNLVLGSCATAGGTMPSIQFTESYDLPIGSPVALFRYYAPGSDDHFYTTNGAELGGGGGGWDYEGVQAYIAPLQQSGTIPLYRYYNGGNSKHFYTTNLSELGTCNQGQPAALGYVCEGVAGYVLPAPTGSGCLLAGEQRATCIPSGTTPLYRYRNVDNGAHFYTTTWSELGGGSGAWVYEGVQCLVWTSP